MKKNQKKVFLIFSCLFGIGIFLRFYHLGFNSLWLDEAFVFKYAQFSLGEIWSKVVVPGVELNPPFFYWLVHFILPFGKSEWLLRLPAALAGILTIPVFYFIGKQVKGKKLGLILAALISFSSYHIYYSQEARTYTLALLFFSLAFYFYLKTVKENKLNYWIWFSVFSALSLWSHYYVILGVGVFFLHSLIHLIFTREYKRIKSFLFSLFIFLILSLPLIIVAGRLFFSETVNNQPSWGNYGWGIISSTLRLFSGYSLWLVIIFLSLLFLSIILYFKKYSSLILLIILCLVVPLLASVFLSTKMPMISRYLLFLLPIYFLGASLPLVDLSEKNVWAGICVTGIIILFTINYYSFYYHYPIKNNWRDFSQNFSQITQDGDLVVSVPDYTEAPLNYYYSSKQDKTTFLTATSVQELEIIKSNSKPTWFVVTGHIRAANPKGDALEWLNKNTIFQGKYSEISLFKNK